MIDYETTRFATEEQVDLRSSSLRALKVRRALAGLPQPCERVLDFGCGEGALTRTLKRLYPRLDVHGCDVSQAQLARAMELGSDITYRQCDGRLAYDDGFFDAVLVLDVLEHVSDPDATMAELARVVRAGGRVLLHCPCEGQPCTLDWLCWRLGVGEDLSRRLSGHIQRLTHHQVLELGQRHGLTAICVRYEYHPLGQVFNRLSYWRRSCQQATGGRSGDGLSRAVARLPWWRISPAIERLAYHESRLLGRLPLAMGVDVWFEKRLGAGRGIVS
jgi:SAM-dependent methyltransferase